MLFDAADAFGGHSVADQQDTHVPTVPAGEGAVNESEHGLCEDHFPGLTGRGRDATLAAPHCGRSAYSSEFRGFGLPTGVLMKLKVRRSKLKRLKKVGFRTRSKTAGGRKVIKRKIRRSGKFRVG